MKKILNYLKVIITIAIVIFVFVMAAIGLKNSKKDPTQNKAHFSFENEQNKDYVLFRPLEYQEGVKDSYGFLISKEAWYIMNNKQGQDFHPILLPVTKWIENVSGNKEDLIYMYSINHEIQFDTVNIGDNGNLWVKIHRLQESGIKKIEVVLSGTGSIFPVLHSSGVHTFGLQPREIVDNSKK